MSNFFSSLLGGGNTAAGYVKTQNGLIARNNALVGTLTDAYNSAARGGAWDPNAALDNLKADTAYQTRINTGNAAGAALTMGYRPGDTAPIQAQNAINNKAALQYADEANAIRTNAAQAGYGAATNLASASSNILGQSMGANGQLINYAQNQDNQQGAFLGNLLGTGLSFLSPAKGVTSALGTFSNGQTFNKRALGQSVGNAFARGFSL